MVVGQYIPCHSSFAPKRSHCGLIHQTKHPLGFVLPHDDGGVVPLKHWNIYFHSKQQLQNIFFQTQMGWSLYKHQGFYGQLKWSHKQKLNLCLLSSVPLFVQQIQQELPHFEAPFSFSSSFTYSVTCRKWGIKNIIRNLAGTPTLWSPFSLGSSFTYSATCRKWGIRFRFYYTNVHVTNSL